MRGLLSSALALLASSSVLAASSSSQQHVLSTDDSSSSSWATIPQSSYAVTSLARSIELGGSTSKSTTVYTLKAVSHASGHKVFVVALDEKDHASLSWIEASTGKTGNSRKAIPLLQAPADAASSAHYYVADLSSVAQGNTDDELALSIHATFIHTTIPKPATLPQDAANQGMYWERDLLGGSHVVFPSEGLPKDSVKVRVKCPTPRAAGDIVPNGWSVVHTAGSAVVQFTNTETILPDAVPQVASIHYEQPEPVLSVRKLERTAQVSHWGNHVAIEDDIKLVNDGPKLKGFFSRLSHQALQYQRRGAAFVAPHTLASLSFQLPPNVHSPYFIDEVGNVSTSRFRPSPRSITVLPGSKRTASGSSHIQLTPRYPLLGGWNYTFAMGYKQPLQDVLRYDAKAGSYNLAIPFLTDLKNAAFDDVTFKIVLPEGAHDITVAYPFPVDTSSSNTTYSYLDSTGRPTITLRKAACSENHATDVLVIYKYTSINLVQKPAAVAGIASLAFAVFALMGRVDWSIKG